MSSFNSSNNSVDFVALQEAHYSLMKRCFIALNYIRTSHSPFITSDSRNWTTIEKNGLPNKHFSKIIYRTIDIYRLKESFEYIKVNCLETKNYFQNIVSIQSFLVFITSLITTLLMFFVFPISVLMLNFNIFKSKFLIFLLTKIYIENINNNLIVLYSRLKATMNSNDTYELKNKLWLTRSINDCKNFNSTFPGRTSKILLALIGLLTPILPVFIKNTTTNKWIKESLEKTPVLYNIISWQLIVLVVIFLPTIIILIFTINSFEIKLRILSFF